MVLIFIPNLLKSARRGTVRETISLRQRVKASVTKWTFQSDRTVHRQKKKYERAEQYRNRIERDLNKSYKQRFEKVKVSPNTKTETVER